MATLYISEYILPSLVSPHGGYLPAGAEPSALTQTVAIGIGSLQSAAFSDRTAFVRVHTDSVCCIAFGQNPTATAVKMRMAANQTEYFGVVPGDKIAVIGA